MNLHWLLRASQWARRPPSMQRVILVVGVIAACLAIAGLAQLLGVETEATRQPRFPRMP